MRQKNVTLGRTGLISGKNAFGALPIQRDDDRTAVRLLKKAFDSGFTFFDTARAYTDSEHKIGLALSDARDKIILATKSGAQNAADLRRDLETSLRELKTDHIDVYQLHNPAFCPRPGDGTGLYEALLKARDEGLIRFIGLTNHRLRVAEEAVNSGLYDTLQFPFCYLATDRDTALVNLCREKNVGFICMKALSGGLITDSRAAYAFIDGYDNALPIWGIQRESELDEFISYISDAPQPDARTAAIIARDRAELIGGFCRSCGYCMPCPQGITIPQCARMSQLIRRSPSAAWLKPEAQAMMLQIEKCVGCRQCVKRCPYGLEIPELLKKNLADYKAILSGEVKI